MLAPEVMSIPDRIVGLRRLAFMLTDMQSHHRAGHPLKVSIEQVERSLIASADERRCYEAMLNGSVK